MSSSENFDEKFNTATSVPRLQVLLKFFGVVVHRVDLYIDSPVFSVSLDCTHRYRQIQTQSEKVSWRMCVLV
jgi:hypothetical protein